MKHVRNLKIQLKPAKTQDFTKIVTSEVLPLLQKQPGFSNELTLVKDNHALAISVWDDKASAERYNQTGYPQVIAKLAGCMEGTPVLETYELAAATR